MGEVCAVCRGQKGELLPLAVVLGKVGLRQPRKGLWNREWGGEVE